MLKEIREKLERSFDERFIKNRKGSFGRTLEYIEANNVIQRLNDVFGGNWSFEVLTKPTESLVQDNVIVLGRLSAPDIIGKNEDGSYKLGNMIYRDQIGGKKVTKNKADGSILDLASDEKAATTDCLKKCASLFGVALDLYGEKEIEEKVEVEGIHVMIPVEKPVVKVVEKSSPLQLQAITTLAAKHKMNVNQLLTKHKVTKLEDLTAEQAKEVIEGLNKVKV